MKIFKGTCFIHWVKRYVLVVVTAFMLLQSVTPFMAYASPYGSSSYNSCSYNCPAQNPPTIVTFLSGLEVSINLTNGQTIPYNGYNIIVTPLNGQGESFTQVAFYINGVLVQTSVPDKTGTVKWFWNPGQYPGNDIKIIITDNNGQSLTKEFNVTVGPKPGTASTAAPSSLSGPAAIVNDLYNGAKHAVEALPKPVVYSFPYFLFILLGINIVILLLQTKRELNEYYTREELLKLIRTISDTKKTFTELVSHYLRTPLTIVMGGIDMLEHSNASPTVVNDLKKTINNMRSKIDALINDTQMITNNRVTIAGLTEGTNALSLWRQPGLFLPLFLIVLVLVPFNFIVAHSSKLSVSQTNLAVQLALFAILALITYQMFRRRQLKRHDATALEKILSEETKINQARDELILNATVNLGDELSLLDNLVANIGVSPSFKYFQIAQKGFHDILGKFSMVSKLKGTNSSEVAVSVKLSDLINNATQNLRDKASQRNITISQIVPETAYVQIQNPELVAFVFNSLIDNAISYSKDNGSIEIGVISDGSGTTFTVKDHGVGIPSDKLPILFQPFSRIGGVEIFTHEGMGFSLYLDKLIITYLSGTIEIASEPNVETTATLRLPFFPSTKTAA